MHQEKRMARSGTNEPHCQKILAQESWIFHPKIIFLYVYESIVSGYSLDSPCQGASNENDNLCFHGQIGKNIH